MVFRMKSKEKLRYLEDRWDDQIAKGLDSAELLRYRSNLLGSDWGIALAAAANGRAKMEEFNRRFEHRLIWLPWQRPGFELAMMLHEAVSASPGCDGVVLGGHGLFTWGDTQRECYSNTLTVIDQLGQFIAQHVEEKGNALFGGTLSATLENQ